MEKIVYNRYPAYKNSGVDWLGEIPEHWEIRKGKWLFIKHERPVFKNDEIITCFRDGQVTLRKNRKTEGFTNALKEHGYQGINKGDLVIHCMDAFAGAIGVSDSNGKSTPVYSVCTSRIEGINHYYYAYFLRNLAKNGFIESLAKGIRERSSDFRFNDLGILLLPLPPLSEQKAIADFLDQKTAGIEKAIAQKEQLIRLLKEQKQILINRAVTRGLNPNTPLKDSGIDWIGAIPEHWEVRRLGFISKVIDPQPDHRAPEIDLTGIPYLGIRDINSDGTINIETARIVKEVALLKQEAAFTINDGDIVFCKVGTLGEPKHINRKGQRIALSATLVIIKIENSFLSRFIKHSLDSDFINHQINLIITGATRPALGIQQIRKFLVPIPSNIEIKEIVNYIDRHSVKIEQAIAMQQQSIEKLKEYKATLIDHAVTGKIRIN